MRQRKCQRPTQRLISVLYLFVTLFTCRDVATGSKLKPMLAPGITALVDVTAFGEISKRRMDLEAHVLDSAETLRLHLIGHFGVRTTSALLEVFDAEYDEWVLVSDTASQLYSDKLKLRLVKPFSACPAGAGATEVMRSL